MLFQSAHGIDGLILKAIGKSLAMIQFTPEGAILDANENFLNALGYRLDEVVGKHHRIFCDREYVQSPAYKQFWTDLANGKSQVSEFRRISKSGEDVWINASYNAVSDKHGKVVRVVKIANDITAEVARRAEIEIISMVANETDNSVIITDAEQNIVYVNPGFTKMTGYSSEEVLGKNPGALLQGPLTTPKTKEEIRTAIRDKKPIYTEILNYHKNGDTYWVSLAINPIINKQGVVEKYISIQSNVSATKERAIVASSQIEAVGRTQAVIEFTMDGNVVTANKNFCDCLGYSLDEIVGKHHRIFVDPAEANAPAYTAFWEKLRRGEYDTRVYKRIAKGGREVWIQASYNAILDTVGKPCKVIKFATEVTNIIETGGMAERGVADAQSVAAAVEEMTASISEISKNMQLSKEAAMGILNDSTQSSAAAAQLGSSMKVMENVVQLINNIAGQVNLLALNATIEAARAGDAGKGFAVVAAEVKNLATQTTKATEDIARQIQEVQSVSEKVAESIETIVTSANNVTQYIVGVASAIEEQSAVTQEISSNTQRMSSSVSDISQRIRALSAI
jgi:methyl-accepting chemotaxis protein